MKRLTLLAVLFTGGMITSATAQTAHFTGAVRLAPERSVQGPFFGQGARNGSYAGVDRLSFEEQLMHSQDGVAATDSVTSKIGLIAHDAGANPTPVGAVNFGSLTIGGAPVAMSLTFTFTSGGTIGTPQVLTMGAPNLDFTDAGTGSCTTNGTSHTYNTNDTCTVNVNFTPKFSGARNGGVVLTGSSGSAIATVYIYGSGTGPQVTYPAVPSTIGNGFGQPNGIAVDGSGNVFVADPTNAKVYEVEASGGYTSVLPIASGFNGPQGIAVDGSGNVFVADHLSAQGPIYELVAAGGYTTQISLGSGFSDPLALAVDGLGNIFVVDNAFPGVFEIPAAGGAPNLLGGGSFTFVSPTSIAVDGSGNLFVVDDNHLVEILKAGGYSTVNSLSSNTLPGITGVAVDANDNLIVVNGNGSGTVYELTAASGYATQQTLASGFAAHLGSVALAGNGDVFVASPAETVAHRLDFSDPPTLTFNSTAAGATSSDSPKTVTLTNSGNAALTFDANATITSGFAIDSNSTCSQSTPLAVGSSCTYLVKFTPVVAGPTSGASLTIPDNAATNQVVPLQGTGTGTTPTITFSSVPNHNFGDPPFQVTATSTNSSVPITYSVVSGPATISGSTVTLTGAGTVVLQASQAEAAGYFPASANAPFMVAAIAPTITFTVPNHNVGDQAFQVNATSNSTGAFTYTVTSGPATISGNTVTLTGAGTVVLLASEAASGGYSTGSATATFAVDGVQIGPSSSSGSSVTVTAGSPASYSLSVTPQGGSTFAGAVTFSVSGQPSDATVTFSPTQIAAGSQATTVTLTVTTSSQDAKTREPFSRHPFGSLVWGLILLPLGNRKLRRQMRNLPIAMLIVCVVGMFSLTSCGGGNSSGGGGGGGITSQTYNLTVTATNGANGATTTTTLTLIVQS